jgi:Spy/CpxP family protein refolding chaperone
MKKTLLIALVLLLTSGMAIAQQNGGPEGPQGGKGNMADNHRGNPGNPVDRLTERLGLDEAQAAEITLIFEEMQLLREEEREKCRATSEGLRESTHAQVMDVLTLEQQALFEAQLQQREQMRQAIDEVRADRGFGGGRGTGDCINN